MLDSQERPDTSKRISGFVARQYTLDEKSGMTEEFLTWASERAIIGGMAVNSAYFTHGASGTGDWYAETSDGLVLVQQQHPEGRPGYDYYSIHEVGGVIFYYSVFGTVGRTDEVNRHDGTIAAGYSLVADRNKPIVKYMLCDNGVVYEMKSTGAYSDGFKVMDDEGNPMAWPGGGNSFGISQDIAAQQEWRRILSNYQ